MYNLIQVGDLQAYSEFMDDIQILNKIIEEDGSCCWAKPSICLKCPLSKLTRYKNSDNTGFMSCVDSLGIDGLSEKEADAKYKQVAMNKLAEILIDNVIQQEDNN